jgi:nucleoside-diphosphate-sugar epimerase
VRDLLITGANGFLGSEVVRQAAAAGLKVRLTDLGDVSCCSGENYYRADILDPVALKPVFEGVNNVIHAAGLAHVRGQSRADKARFKEINEIGTANVAQGAARAGVRHFVLVSSVSVYGGISRAIDETVRCHPDGPYAESKWQAEQRAIEISQVTGMSLTILRLATLYGEGDPGNVARLMRMIDHGRFLWMGNGSNRKSLLHREDAARAILLVMQRPASGVTVYNVSAFSCTMREVVDGLAGPLGKRIPPFGIPASWVRGLSSLLTLFPMSRLRTLVATLQKWFADDVYDVSKYAQAFNFQERVNLADGLRREVAWYQKEQAKRGT